MANLTDVNGYPLKFEAQLSIDQAEKNAKKLKDLLGSLHIDMKPASKSLESVTTETKKTVTVTKDLKSAFDHLTGSAEGVHTSIAKARSETQNLAQTERDLRKALKEKLITDDEYIKKLSLISKRRTELSDKLREYRAELKKTQVQEKEVTKPYSSSDTAFEISKVHGGADEIKSGTVVNSKEIDKATASNKAFAASSKEAADSQVKQASAGKTVVDVSKEQDAIINRLKVNLKEYKQLADGATDPKLLKGYNAEIQSIETEIKQMSNVGKVGFDDLGNAIKGTNKQTSGLVRGLSSGIEMLRRMAYIIPGLGLTGIVALMIEPVNKLINSLGKVKKAVAESFNDSSYKDAIKNVTQLKNNIELANKGIISKDKVTKQYNDTMGKVTGKLNSFNEVSRKVADQSSDYIKAIKMRMEAQALLSLSVDQTVEAQKRMFEGGTWKQKAAALAGAALSGGDVLGGYERILSQITQEELASLADVSDSAMGAYENLLKKSEEFNKKHGFDFDRVDNSQSYQSSQKLLQRIADLRAEYSRKVMSSDEEEIQSVRDKFKKIANEVKLFNANPKNKIKVSTGDLDSIRDTAIEDLIFKQDTVRLTKEVEKQKAIFQEFEDFKLKTTEKQAFLRYGAEMAEFDTFEKYLEKHQKGLYETAQTRDLSRGEVDRLKFINEQLDSFRKDERVKESQRYLDAYEAAKTHNQKLLDIDDEYYRRVAELGNSATIDQINVLDKDRKERISAETSANLKILTNWEETFANMSKMSKKSVEKYLEDARSRVETERRLGKITAQEYRAMIKEIDEAQANNTTSFGRVATAFKKYRDEANKTIVDNEKLESSFRELASVVSDASKDANQVLGALSDSFKQLGIGDESLDKTMDSVMGMVGGIGEIGEGIASKNPVAIVTGSIKLLSSALDLFNTKDKKLQKQIDGYQKQLESLGKAYKQLERDISSSVGESFYTDSEKAIQNMNGQIEATQKMLDAERNKKKSDKGKIQEYENQIEDLKFKIEDTQKAISEMLLQSDFKAFSSSLASALMSAFEAGEDGIDAMDKAFKTFIKNAVSNSAMLKFIQPIIDEMMNSATDYASKNENSLLGFGFEEWSDKINAAGVNFMDYISGAFESFGIDREIAKGKGLAGAIGKSITEDTANKWMGIQLNIYTISKDTLIETRSQSDLIRQSNNYAMRSLAEVVKIERNTANTVDRLDTAIVHLTAIATNTTQGKTARDLG